MLFHEIYNSYFLTVQSIIQEALKERMTPKRLNRLIQVKAFGESVLTLPKELYRWPLLLPDGSTVLQHRPQRPLTILEKRWLKTIISDPRIQLFDPSMEGLEEVEPLFNWEDIIYYDRYQDGDNFLDSCYKDRFRLLLQAIQEQQLVRFNYTSKTGMQRQVQFIPIYLEYSSKDDKFRVIGKDGEFKHPLRLSRLEECQLLGHCENDVEEYQPSRAELTFLLEDERKALDRVLLHFSHFAKRTEKITNKTYKVILEYDPEDEAEMLIRILSFGPVIQVQSPPRLVEKIKVRLRKQLDLLEK